MGSAPTHLKLPRLRPAGEVQEDVFQLDFFRGEINDRKPGGLNCGQNFAAVGLAGGISEDQLAAVSLLDIERREYVRQGADILVNRHHHLLGVQALQQFIGCFAGDQFAIVDDSDPSGNRVPEAPNQCFS